MIAIVEQALGDIHRGDACGFILQTVEHELMTAEARDGQFIDILQRLLDVVGIEGGQRTDHLHVFTSQGEDIGIGAHHDGIVALIGRHAGEERLQAFTHTNGTTAWSASAMRGGERLMQVDVHHIEAHVAWATGSQHRVEVGTIVVHQATTAMDERCDLWDSRLEETEGVGVGHHHGGDGIAF